MNNLKYEYENFPNEKGQEKHFKHVFVLGAG